MVVGHDPNGDFDLIVRADGKELLRKPVDAKTAPDLWLTDDIDLSDYAGKSVKVELVNQPSGWIIRSRLLGGNRREEQVSDRGWVKRSAVPPITLATILGSASARDSTLLSSKNP